MKTKTAPKGKITFDQIQALNAQACLKPCGLAEFLKATLQPDEIATVYRALSDPSIKATSVYAVLIDRGYKQNCQVLTRHRTRGCEVCGQLGFSSRR